MNNKMLLAVLLTAGISTAFASGLSHATSPWFVGGSLALTHAKHTAAVVTGINSGVTSNAHSNKHAGAHFNVGYQDSLTPNFVAGVEGGWGWYGSNTYHSTTVPNRLKTSLSGFNGNAFIGYRLTRNAIAYAHAGMGYLRIKAENGNPTLAGSDTSTSTWKGVPMFGASIAYKMTKSISAIFNYSHFAGDDLRSGATASQLTQKIPSLDSFQIGLKVNV